MTDVNDDKLEKILSDTADEVGKAAHRVAELGIGTNIGASSLTGNVLLDEKIAGTVHIAIGDNHAIGRTSKITYIWVGFFDTP